MPPSFIALDSQAHRQHGWKRPADFSFAADSWAPVLHSEIPSLLDGYPLAFIARPAGGYQLGVMLGISAGENLFLDAQGRWRVNYVPSYFRAYPFALGTATVDGQNRTLLCCNQRSGLYREAPDESRGELRFFDDAGQLQPLMRKLLAFLQSTQAEMRKTQQAVDALQAAGLIVPWTENAEQAAAALNKPWPLCRVDAAALAALDQQALVSLRDVGALPIAYAQLFSVPRLRLLSHFQALKQQAPTPTPAVAPAPAPAPDQQASVPASTPPPEPATALPPALAALLGETQDSGTLNFDWLTKK